MNSRAPHAAPTLARATALLLCGVALACSSDPTRDVTGPGDGSSAPGARWVTGYYAGHQRDLYPETSVDFSYLTHVIVAAVEPTSAGGLDTSFFTDAAAGPAMARALTARAHQFGRKAIMMIGGSQAHDELVAASSPTRRAKFVADLVSVMNGYGFDGIDVDWEPVEDADKPAVLQLLKDLRAAKPGLVITLPVEWVNTNFGADAWYAQVAPLVDQLNVMTYEMADNWGGWVSWHSAALYGDAGDHPSSVSSSEAAYVKVGVPAAKLGVGIAAYGSCWQGVGAMLQPLDGKPAGVAASDNDMSYANIVGLYYQDAAYHWDATARAGYLGYSAPAGPRQCSMISFEDPHSVTEKGAYVKGERLGGVMFWTINEQHLSGAAPGQRDPLLQAAYAAVAP